MYGPGGISFSCQRMIILQAKLNPKRFSDFKLRLIHGVIFYLILKLYSD